VGDKARDGFGRWLARHGDVRDPDRLADELASVEDAIGDRGSIETAIAAIVVAAACARLGVAWDVEVARAITARTGTIAIGPEVIDIEIPLAAVDVEVRRAGLDRDPGWVPWLARKLRIVYVPGEGEVL
jgi:hypothetical protein